MTDSLLGIDFSNIPSPCFVLDEKKLIRNLKILHNIQHKAQIQILCALKGFAMWSTFPIIQQYLSGLTASSLNEAKLCYNEYGQKAHLCAPVYLEKEIDEITNIVSHITFNSLNQFERFGQIAVNKKLKIGLRINPEYSEIETDIYNPCAPGSRLGITLENLLESLPKEITGLHFHSMCEQNADVLERTLGTIEKRFKKYLRQVSWLNIGGGHLFTDRNYKVKLFIDTMLKFKQKYNLKIIAEPGEAVGWQAGYLVATVQDVVITQGVSTAMLDTSFAAHMPDCLEMPYKPRVLSTTIKSSVSYNYRLGGNTCLAGDFIEDYSFEEPLKPGDKIVFDDMMHYTMVKTTTFNGVNLPSIGIIKIDGSFEQIREFGYEDYKSRLS